MGYLVREVQRRKNEKEIREKKRKASKEERRKPESVVGGGFFSNLFLFLQRWATSTTAGGEVERMNSEEKVELTGWMDGWILGHEMWWTGRIDGTSQKPEVSGVSKLQSAACSRPIKIADSGGTE